MPRLADCEVVQQANESGDIETAQSELANALSVELR